MRRNITRELRNYGRACAAIERCWRWKSHWAPTHPVQARALRKYVLNQVHYARHWRKRILESSHVP